MKELPLHKKQKLNFHKSKINSVCWNNLKYKYQLISVDSAGVMNVSDVTSNKNTHSFQLAKTWLTSVDVDKTEGRYVACGTMDSKILITEINMNQKNTTREYKNKIELLGINGQVQCL